MKIFFKFIVVILFWGKCSEKLYAQNLEIKTIDSLIHLYKDKDLKEDIEYSVFKNLNIYNNQANFPEIFDHLNKQRQDSIPMVRRVANNFISTFLAKSTEIETAKTAFRYIIESSSDSLGGGNWASICYIRTRFKNEIYADTEFQKAIVEIIKKDIEGYSDCVRLLVAKDRDLILDFAKEHYTPLGKNYHSENLKGDSYYYGVEWYTLRALGSAGDKDAISLMIKKVEEEKDLTQRFVHIRELATMVGGRDIANLFYAYYMDDKWLQKIPDSPQRGGGIEYGGYMNYEYLRPTYLFLNPLTKEEKTIVDIILNRKIDPSNEKERLKKEMDYIMFFRKWLTENKNNWIILNEK